MDISPDATVAFSEEVPSHDRVLNPLGIHYHRRFQDVFLPGITSVTKRIRYYTLQGWYYQHLYDDKVMTPKQFERLFILACLKHHSGDAGHPALRRIHNRYRFDGEWEDHDRFTLEFDIAGRGHSDYKSQLETFRTTWSDALGRAHRTKLNERLADTIDLSPEQFESEAFTKEDLDTFAPLCPCRNNPAERELLSKIFFGFFTETETGWDVDDAAYSRFQEGDIELEFEGTLRDDELPQAARTRQQNLRRRNTLFLFLKIVSETNPSSVRRSMWDGIYFGQSRDSHADIEFGVLERVRRYWEFFQLAIYYLYAVESLLDVLQRAIRETQGIRQDDLLEALDNPDIYGYIEDIVGSRCNTVGDVLEGIEAANGKRRSDLDCPVNESSLYDRISDSNDWREVAAVSVVLLLALALRYDLTPEAIRTQVGGGTEPGESGDPLDIHTLFETVTERRGDEVGEWLQDLTIQVKRRHLLEAASSFHNNNTRGWLFTEESGRLQFARHQPIDIRPRDNRWGSVQSLLTDLEFVTESDDELVTTERGEQWLHLIE